MKLKKILFACVCLVWFSLWCGSEQVQAQTVEIPGEAIIQLVEGVIPDSLLVGIPIIAIDSLLGSNTYLISFPDSLPVLPFITQLSELLDVIFATVNLRMTLPEVLQVSQGFSDNQAPAYVSGESPPSYFNQAGVYSTGIDSAHLISTGQNVIVAVIDNGVETTHPLMGGYLTANGFDFVGNDNDPSEEAGFAFGHGTFVAGLIRLWSPGAQILPLRVFDGEGVGSSFNISKAIYHAIENGATVINMSFGSYVSDTLLHLAINDALDSGIVLVAAAGNDSLPIAVYPAAYDGVLAVSAIGEDELLADFSNYGNHIGICAPGVNLYSSMAGTYDWGTWSGTSFSAPIVSATTALMISHKKGLTPAKIVTHIETAARRQLLWGSVIAPDQRYGHGVLDAFSAVVSVARGDLDLSGSVDIGDVTRMIDYLFIGHTLPDVTIRTADIDCNSDVDIGDLTLLIGYLFVSKQEFSVCR